MRRMPRMLERTRRFLSETLTGIAMNESKYAFHPSLLGVCRLRPTQVFPIYRGRLRLGSRVVSRYGGNPSTIESFLDEGLCRLADGRIVSTTGLLPE